MNEPREASGNGIAIAFAIAWLCLLVLHYVLMLSFAGWLGTADDFIPWSITALLLWLPTRGILGLKPLRASRAGRAVLIVGLVLVGAALFGVDEGRIPGMPDVPVAVFYALLPLAIVVAVWGLILRSVIRRSQSLSSAV